MAYTKTIWIDRLVERALTYFTSTNPDTSISLVEAPGTIYAEGTPVNAKAMNNIENGIAALDSKVGLIAGIANSTIVTEANYALDARQLNKNVAGSFAAKAVTKDEVLITVAVADWVATTGGFYATKTLTGATAATNADWCMKIAGNIPTDAEEINNNMVKNAVFGTNTITFYSKTSKPSAQMQFRVKGV